MENTFLKNKLLLEASYIHRSIFKDDILAEIAEKYIESHKFLDLKTSPEQDNSLNTIIQKKLDIEAIELVIRRKHNKHPLSKKIHTLCYLVENHYCYSSMFINETDCTLKAWFALIVEIALHSIFKFIKGKYLLWRYDIV